MSDSGSKHRSRRAAPVPGDVPPPQAAHGVEAPELTRLRLAPGHLDALRTQGFVSCETRRGRPVFKLRFRCGGRQVVRGLGSDAARAERVRQELAVLQRVRRQDVELTRISRVARRALRTVKQCTAPTLAARGLFYHGLEIRRARSAAARGRNAEN